MRDIKVEAKNDIKIAGKLIDITFREGRTSAGKDYESATATIRVTQTYFGREETSDIPVSFFSTKYKNDGKPNPGYANLQQLKTKKTAANVGIDSADVLYLSKVKIKENNFPSRVTGQLINSWQLNGSFFSSGAANETATFDTEIYIFDIHDELDSEQESTGRLIIRGGIVGYNEDLSVIDFIVEAPDCVDYISRAWSPNDFVNVQGRIRYTVQEIEQKVSKSSWGEEIPSGPSTKTVRELIITNGSDEAYDEEFAYNPTDIKKIFNIRKAKLEQMQINAKGGSQPAPKKATPSWDD